MARNSARNANFTLAAAAFGVVAFGAAVGYFVFGRPLAPVSMTPTPAPTVGIAPASSLPVSPPIAARPRDKNTNFTAAGAPDISITEAKSPTLTDKSQKPASDTPAAEATPDISTPDVETPPAASSPAARPAAASKPAAPPGSTPDAPPTVAAPPAPSSADPDYEKVADDPEASQEGAGNAGRPLFRVQSASFAQRQNAQRLADALKERGFTTSTRAERDGDKTVYKVQVGAFRTRAAANKAASDLKNSGYPASVSPAGP